MLGLREHQPVSVRANTAITGSRFIKRTTTENEFDPCGAGELADGVAKHDIALDEIGLAHLDGDLEVEASEAISVNDEIASAAEGKAAVAAAADYILGYALTAAAADGDMIVVRMVRGANVKA